MDLRERAGMIVCGSGLVGHSAAGARSHILSVGIRILTPEIVAHAGRRGWVFRFEDRGERITR